MRVYLSMVVALLVTGCGTAPVVADVPPIQLKCQYAEPIEYEKYMATDSAEMREKQAVQRYILQLKYTKACEDDANFLLRTQ